MIRTRLLLAGALVGCHRVPLVGSDAQLDVAVAASSDAAPGARPAVQSARCHALPGGLLFDEGQGPDALDIGDGLAHAGGYAVGLVHPTSAGRGAAVALLAAAADVARIVELGPTLGDAPPPRLASCRNQLWAGVLALAPASADGGARDMRRDLALYVVDSEAPQRMVFDIPQQGDESYAFDLACSGAAGIAVWDETTTARPGIAARGVIRASSFGVGQRRADPHDVSPQDSDAEMPRIVSYGNGFFVLWIAHRPESPLPGRGREAEAAAVIESAGEARAYGWLEMMALDASGTATGSVQHLTSTAGHVSAYDVQSHVAGPKPAILVVARDDGEAVDGSGGTLLRVRVRENAAEPPVEVPTDGLGRGAPMFVEGPTSWIAWVDAREELRLLPLDDGGDIVAPASAEEELNEARPLLSLGVGRKSSAAIDAGGPSSLEGPILVAVPKEAKEPRKNGSRLRVFACPR